MVGSGIDEIWVGAIEAQNGVMDETETCGMVEDFFEWDRSEFLVIEFWNGEMWASEIV